ncbi:MAG: hypothetical protein Q8Q03_00445 [bacterium]|nr:hypothetical protein [bacterium]
MTTYNLMKKLYREIDRLNEEIDMRIERGLSYKVLARRHKYLMEELRSIDPQPIVSRGIMNRLAQYVSVFLV